MAEDEQAQQAEQAEFLRRLEEEFRKLTVADVLGQTVFTVSQLAWQRLAPGEGRDLEQARLGIEALRALVPVLKDAVPPEVAKDFQQALTSLQLAYAGAVSEGAAPAPPAEEPPEPEQPVAES